jgi:hypothetical protein
MAYTDLQKEKVPAQSRPVLLVLPLDHQNGFSQPGVVVHACNVNTWGRQRQKDLKFLASQNFES